MQWTITGAGPTNSASIRVTDPGSRWQYPGWHLYATGTFGANTPSVQLQLSPDDAFTTDANSRWASPAALKLSAPGDQFFQARFRKVRVNFTGGDGTTSILVEVV